MVMIGYIYLVLTIIFETAAIILMKMADGPTNKKYLILGSICYTATFFLLTMALKHLPMGYTNAIWAGSSTLLVYVASMYYFDEKTNFIELIFLLCIIIGLIGLNFLQKGK
jgi:small multidrug resistance pump